MKEFVVVNFNKGNTTKKRFYNYPAAEKHFAEAEAQGEFEILTLMTGFGMTIKKVTTL